MDEFGRNESNLTNLNENNNMKQKDNRVPEYSFWAEQMSSTDSNQRIAKEIYYGAENSATMQSNDNTQNYEGNTPKKRHRVSGFIFKAACFGILAGAGFIGALTLYDRLNPEQVKESRYILGAVDTDTDIQEIELKVLGTDKGVVKTTSQDAVSRMVDQTMPSIVSITSVTTQTDAWFGGDYDREGSGSGIIVGKTDEELLLATNNHVVEGANQITVTFIDGEKVEAVIKGTDSAADLAVISIDIKDMKEATLKDIKIAKLGNSDEIKVGEMTVAIGNALGYGQSVTVGYVSAKDRKLEFSDNYSYKTMVLLQTDAAINPGNSGGALLNIEGEVIGINTVKYSSSEVEGMGYAIPISRAT
ncbi:MAG TPA: trypsin-like peptidase domain-containing protein, partial [Mobilitalea sp.]|nr:trypsin-like peptidase domain-containing protein [Mobilitalea sp.]